MSYYEDEILKELKVGEKYTGRQLLIYSLNNYDTCLLSKSCQRFTENNERAYRILDVFKGYLHNSHSSGAIYRIPSTVSTIYIVE